MKNKIQPALIILILLTISFPCFSQSGLYFGQKPPGNTAEIFAPGVISIPTRYEHDLTFSPDGKEMYYSLSKPEWSDFTIYYSKEVNGSWTKPDTAEFSKKFRNTEIVFSPNGQKILFASSRPPGGLPWNFGIWQVDKSSSGLSIPQEVGLKSILPNDGIWHPAITDNSALYFSAYRMQGMGKYDIYRSQKVDGGYKTFELLSNSINSAYDDWYPWIAPDNSFIIFSSNRPGGFGDNDLYISFQNKSGSWTQAINLGANVNSSKSESSPRITADGKYLIFTRMTNWDGDFYWISASFIDEFKPTVGVESEQQYIPVESSLQQNYPNPFNPSTKIKFSLSKNSFTKLEVFNLLGQKVDELLNRELSAGTHEIKFNAANLTAGTYFYRIQAGEYSEVKKLVLVK